MVAFHCPLAQMAVPCCAHPKRQDTLGTKATDVVCAHAVLRSVVGASLLRLGLCVGNGLISTNQSEAAAPPARGETDHVYDFGRRAPPQPES